jgi:hypothetical protein
VLGLGLGSVLGSGLGFGLGLPLLDHRAPVFNQGLRLLEERPPEHVLEQVLESLCATMQGDGPFAVHDCHEMEALNITQT